LTELPLPCYDPLVPATQRGGERERQSTRMIASQKRRLDRDTTETAKDERQKSREHARPSVTEGFFH
jgi:hypothetical protein